MDKKSLELLDHVHPQLASVILVSARRFEKEHGDLRIRVTSGLRTEAEQLALFKLGKSRTTKSKHMFGLAVDVAVIEGKEANWNFAWFRLFNLIVQKVAADFDVSIGWGGDWKMRDGCHFYLADPGEWTIPTALQSVKLLESDAATTPAKDGGARSSGLTVVKSDKP